MSKKIVPMLVTILAVIVILSYFFYQKFLVAATVNGKPISRLVVIGELEKQGGKQVLDSVITKVLLAEQGKKENVSVSQDEINKELKKIESNVASQGGTIDEVLKQQGMTKDSLAEEVKIQVMVQKLVKTDKITVTDKEVEEYIKNNKEQFPANAKEKPDVNQIKDVLKQQKIQSKIQEFMTNLRSKAKINYFGTYK